MRETLRNLKTTEHVLPQPLTMHEGDWLVGRLLAQRGVADAKWVTNARKLLVVYDADLFGAAELADYLDTCGISVAGVRAAHA
jgi:hypothetical protein